MNRLPTEKYFVGCPPSHSHQPVLINMFSQPVCLLLTGATIPAAAAAASASAPDPAPAPAPSFLCLHV